MSTNLYWQRKQPVKGQIAGDRLKHILREKFTRLETGAIEMNSADMCYLAGLRDAGVEDAEKLMQAIERYGTLELWIAE